MNSGIVLHSDWKSGQFYVQWNRTQRIRRRGWVVRVSWRFCSNRKSEGMKCRSCGRRKSTATWQVTESSTKLRVWETFISSSVLTLHGKRARSEEMHKWVELLMSKVSEKKWSLYTQLDSPVLKTLQHQVRLRKAHHTSMLDKVLILGQNRSMQQRTLKVLKQFEMFFATTNAYGPRQNAMGIRASELIPVVRTSWSRFWDLFFAWL